MLLKWKDPSICHDNDKEAAFCSWACAPKHGKASGHPGKVSVTWSAVATDHTDHWKVPVSKLVTWSPEWTFGIVQMVCPGHMMKILNPHQVDQWSGGEACLPRHYHLRPLKVIPWFIVPSRSSRLQVFISIFFLLIFATFGTVSHIQCIDY